MSRTATETRTFKMHPQLLLDVIQRQAGTLAKAILEGVMNSVDAKATKCTVQLVANTLVIQDDGQGFRNKEEIANWFEVFGKPHEESEKKVYGTFRMGRGQLFAYGANEWAAGRFRMSVDVKNNGFDYELQECPAKETFKGCAIAIELYEPLLPSDLDDTERLIEQWVRWCPIPVLFNDRLISKDPTKAKWSEVLPEAYISLKPTGGLSVYNLGIHVLEFPRHRFGTGGEIVSRKQLRVNFARNDIQSDCKVWPLISKVVDQRATGLNKTKKTLDDAGRQRLADQLLRGQLGTDDVFMLKLVTAVTGRHYPLRVLYDAHCPLTVTNGGSHKGDTVHRQKLAFVLSKETLDRFHVETLQDLMDKIVAIAKRSKYEYIVRMLAKVKLVDFAAISAHINETHTLLEALKLTDKEQLWLSVVKMASKYVCCAELRGDTRKLCIGVSETAKGWTDGETFIALSRSWLAKQSCSLIGFTKVGHLMLHELCHHTPDNVDHDHDQEFFEEFHDSIDSVANFVDECLRQLPKLAKQLGRRIDKRALRDQDMVAKVDLVMAEFPHVGIRKK